MKKIIFLLIACSLPLFVFASDVGNLLKEAQTAYESGDVSTAIQTSPPPVKLIQTMNHYMYGHKTGTLTGYLGPFRNPILTQMTQRCTLSKARHTGAQGWR